MTSSSGKLGVDEDDIALMRKVRKREHLGLAVRFFGCVLAGLGGIVVGALAFSNYSSYPYSVVSAGMAGTRSKIGWKTPLLLVASFLVGIGLVAIGNAYPENFGAGSYYGTYSRTR